MLQQHLILLFGKQFSSECRAFLSLFDYFKCLRVALHIGAGVSLMNPLVDLNPLTWGKL